MKRFLGIIICCFVVATAYIAYVIAERQTALQKFARYNDSWAVGQTVSEYMRLEHRLAAYALGLNDVDRDEVRLRLDIMIGRVELLKQGNLHAFVEQDPQRRELLVKLTTCSRRCLISGSTPSILKVSRRHCNRWRPWMRP